MDDNQILETLARLVANQSGFAGRAVADRIGSGGGSDAKAYKMRDDADRNFDASVKRYEAATKGMKYTTDVFTKKLGETFARSESSLVRGLSNSVKTLEDALRFKDQATAMDAVVKQLQSLDRTHYENREELEEHFAEVSKMADKAGWALEDMGVQITRSWNVQTQQYQYFINNQQRVTERLTEQTKELTDAFEEAEFETKKHTDRVEYAKEKVGKFGEVLKHTAKEFMKFAEQEQRFAQQTATADAGWIEGIKEMGISQLAYMKILKDTRHVNLAMNTSGVDFKKSLIESQKSLRGLTTNYEEAAKVSGMFHKNMARIGVSQDQLGDAVLQQTKIYEDNYRALGYTAEEFANLTNELINDQGMRDVLLTLQEKERKAYVLGIQQRMAEYQTMGYTIDRAKELQKTFQNLVGMDPRERMKQAAKKRAMMGAMGMGSEATELFNLEVQYRTMTADQKKDADIRMAQIQSDAAKTFGEMSGAGSSLGQSMAMQVMASKTGFDQVARTFETESGQGLVIDKAQLEKTNEISTTAKNILGAMDYWGAASNSAIGSLATNLITGIGGIVLGMAGKNMLGSIFSKLGMSGLGSMFGMGGAGAGGGMLGGAGGMLARAGGVGLAGAAGYGVGTLINNNLGEDTKETISDVVGTAVDSVLSFFGSDEAQKRLDTKAFADYYAAEGGSSSRKTAAKQESEKMRVDKDEQTEKMMKMQLQRDEDISMILQKIDEHLKMVNMQNTEQAKAVSETGKAINDQVRRSNFKGKRPSTM